MALSAGNQAGLIGLSTSNVAQSLAGVRRFLKLGRWIAKTNRYARNTTDVLAREIRSGIANNGRHLAQYVSVSSLLHCEDGWSYLGRSLQAMFQGDANTSLHLAYYAELRAAMSLLACEGIGVFKNHHFTIDAPNHVKKLPNKSPTHEFAWDCLSNWAQQNSSGATFAGIVRPHGRSLEDWLAPIGGSVAIAPQARDWFRQWGMDLMLLAQDREARNSVSYRPAGIPAPNLINASTVVQFAANAWALLEPSSPSSFDSVDRHILRLSVERWFEGRNGKKPSALPQEFQTIVKNLVARQNLNAAVATEWERFLQRQIDQTDPPVFHYSTLPPDPGADSLFAIFSRATLLLRIATGATANLFDSAGISKDAIGFWRKELGFGRGLWNRDGEPPILTDLWTDVAAALTDAEQFCDGLEKNKTYHHLGSSLAHISACLGGCERVAVWSVAAV